MYNTYVTSAVTHRTRGSPSFSFSSYSYHPNARYSFVCSSSRTCLSCSCCTNSMYKVPLNPGYCCDLSVSRQSSLIQCRKLGFGGFNPCYYSREPVYDADRRFYCDKMCNASEKRGRLRKCLVIEERNESYDLGELDEADVLLSLLSEDIGEECYRVRKVINRSVKKPNAKKRENSMSKDGQVKLCVFRNEVGHDNEMTVSSSRKEENKRQEGAKRAEKRDTLLKKENQNAIIQFEKIENRREQKPFLRNEVSKSKEQRAETLRGEEHRDRLRKDASSCSSYYSFSSAGDYESENDAEHNEGKFVGDKSSVAINETAYKEGNKVEERRNNYKKNTALESRASSSVIESDFRKSSEKKLTDFSIQEKEYREGALLKHSRFSMVQESDRGESSNSSTKYENREVKSSGSHVLDIEKTKLLNKQTRNEVSVQSEQNMKYKQFVATDNNDVKKFYGSQKRYSSSDDVSAKVTNSSQKSVVNYKSDDQSTNKVDENQMNSLKVSEVSNVIDVDIKKTSFSGKALESHLKSKEDCSTDMHTSSFDAHKKHQIDEVSKSQQLTIRESTSMLKKSSDSRFTKHEENVNLAYGSSLESKQPHPQINADLTVKVGSQPSAIFLEEHDKKNSGLVRIESTKGSTTEILQVQEDAIGSASRLQESSAKYVGVFVDKAKHEISSSQIQLEKKTSEERKEYKILVQDSSQSSKLKETDSRLVSHSSGIKGPSDEIWKLDEHVVPELQEDAGNTKNTIQKRTGRSLWNIIGDIIRLRLSSRSESRSTGAKSSPNQSTSSDTYFSGHEAEENEESKTTVTQEPSEREENISSQNKETSILSTVEGHLEHAEVNVPSSSFFLELSGDNSGDTSNTAAILQSSISLPQPQLRRSSTQQSVPEAGEANISESGPEEQEQGNEKELKRGKLQRKDQIMKDKYDEWGEAYRVEAEQRKLDETFMKEALLEAQKAGDNWEVPVGAVLVHNGQIIARGSNLVEELRDSTAHAEMICIREASNVLRSWRLSEATLYVTLEPCPMCAGAILQARIDTVVWGAPNKLLGADGSWIRLFPNGKGENELEESDKPAAPVHPFHPKITIRRGILASECAETMQEFFQLRRKKKEKKLEASSSSAPPQLPHHHHHPSKFLRRMHDAFMYCL